MGTRVKNMYWNWKWLVSRPLRTVGYNIFLATRNETLAKKRYIILSFSPWQQLHGCGFHYDYDSTTGKTLTTAEQNRSISSRESTKCKQCHFVRLYPRRQREGLVVSLGAKHVASVTATKSEWLATDISLSQQDSRARESATQKPLCIPTTDSAATTPLVLTTH